MTYFCTKCSRNHKSGKIFEEHKEFASKEMPVEKKHAPTGWEPHYKTERMSRYDEDGKYIERYMTFEEKLVHAREIARAQGKKWNWFKEFSRKRKLAKLNVKR